MPEENQDVLAQEGATEAGGAAVDEAAETAGQTGDTLTSAADILAASGGGEAWYALGPLIDKGGWIVVILLILSVISLAVILLKVVKFWAAGLSKRSFVDPAVSKFEAGDTAGVLDLLKKHKTPL